MGIFPARVMIPAGFGRRMVRKDDYTALMFLPSESVKSFPDVAYVPMQGGGKSQPWMMPVYGQGVEAEVMDFLYGLVRLLRPGLVVDLGSHIGMSAYALGCGVRDASFGRVVSCDIEQEHVETTKKRVQGLPVAVWLCSAADLPEVEMADLLFVDCDYDNRIGTLKRMKPGAWAVMHDTRQEPILREAIEKSGLRAVHGETWRGFSVIQR